MGSLIGFTREFQHAQDYHKAEKESQNDLDWLLDSRVWRKTEKAQYGHQQKRAAGTGKSNPWSIPIQQNCQAPNTANRAYPLKNPQRYLNSMNRMDPDQMHYHFYKKAEDGRRYYPIPCDELTHPRRPSLSAKHHLRQRQGVQIPESLNYAHCFPLLTR